MSKVSIIMGSKSDMPVADKAIAILRKFGVQFDIAVASAHRTPRRVEDLVTGSDADVFISIAGLSAALPGVVASYTVKPVIGVPVSGSINIHRADASGDPRGGGGNGPWRECSRARFGDHCPERCGP